MSSLLRGCESAERVGLLLQLTSATSEGVADALRSHLTDGHALVFAADLHDVKIQNVRRTLAVLEEKAGIVEQIKDLDWLKFKSDK